jgi:hypothetical protein
MRIAIEPRRARVSRAEVRTFGSTIERRPWGVGDAKAAHRYAGDSAAHG